MRHCILGGTFTYVHSGHLALLKQCSRFQKITVGITSDSYVRKHKLYPSFSLKKRINGLRAALKKLGIYQKTQIVVIEDAYGGAEKMKDVDAIVVSSETAPVAEKINEERVRRGLTPLNIIKVPIVYGQDLQKISSAKIYEGKIDAQGNLKRPILIQVATDNPTKLEGARAALSKIFGNKFKIGHHGEDSKVGSHPFDQRTFEGARNRAHAAWRRAQGCGYALGIESGIFSKMQKGQYLDITVCCVYDGINETYGTGMGFAIPKEIAKRIKETQSDLSAVMQELTGIRKIGYREGALGWFSAGLFHRKEQVEAAVACAFVPRIAAAKRCVEL
ncbi:MAG: inosine/xanthosine triphosphatase [Candidatus Anstonellaceae archaeon]